MKKVLRNIVCGLAAVNLIALAASCSDGLDDDDPFVKSGVVTTSGGNNASGNSGNEELPADEYESVEVTEIAGVETSWTDTDDLKVGTTYTSQLTVGSKIYFDVAKKGEYLKFHVDNGSWGACGVSEYFNSDGTKVPGTEKDTENAGVYNIDVSDGVYYIEVTADNIDQLKAGFAIHGNLVINKVTLKIKKATVSASTGNAAASSTDETEKDKPAATGDAAIELVKPADKEGYYTFWAQSSGAKKGSVMFIVNYESTTLDKAVELSNVDIEYIINDGTAQHYTENISIPKNQYGTDYQAKVPLFANYEVKKNDAIYVKISAKVNDEAAASIIQGNLIDTDSSVKYWKEMCPENQQKQILSGITYEASSEGNNGEQNQEATTDSNVIWTGTAELDWDKGDDSGACINKDKFEGKSFVGLKFTISSFVQDATTIKIMAQDDWSDITPFESAEGDCMIANSGDVENKALWVWGDSATVKFSDSNIERIKNNGIKFYGSGVTITKVELVTE